MITDNEARQNQKGKNVTVIIYMVVLSYFAIKALKLF